MLGVRCDVEIFKLTASAQSIYREVYGWTKKNIMNHFFIYFKKESILIWRNKNMMKIKSKIELIILYIHINKNVYLKS